MSVTEYWENPTYVGEPDVTEHTGFILSEDEAIKSYLSGMLVPNPQTNNTTPVKVWFRYPEGERRIDFPFITIDLIGVNPDYSRWTSHHIMDPMAEVEFFDQGDVSAGTGLYFPSVSPTLVAGEENTIYQDIHPYLPYELLYQITVHSRSALHDKLLWSRFMTDIFPPRPFWVGVQADQTWRRCELRDVTQADITETSESGSKRVFRKVYTVSMDAEIPQNRVYAVEKAYRIHVDVYENPPLDGLEAADHAHDAEHDVAIEHFDVEANYVEQSDDPLNVLLTEDGDPILFDPVPLPSS